MTGSLNVSFIFYKNIYFKINNTAKTYNNGLTFLPFPHTKLINTYEIIPTEIPSEML